MNEITKMFVDSIGNNKKQKEYMVLARNKAGQERELGPYSLGVARMVQEEYSCLPFCEIMDCETGELID